MEAVLRGLSSTFENRTRQSEPSSLASVDSTSDQGLAGTESWSSERADTYSNGTMSGLDEMNWPALIHSPRRETICSSRREAFLP